MKTAHSHILSQVHTIFTLGISVAIMTAILFFGQYYVITTLKPLVILLDIDVFLTVLVKIVRSSDLFVKTPQKR